MRLIKILTVVFLILPDKTFCQFKKGSTLLGGDFSFSLNKFENANNPAEKAYSLNLSPVFGKAFRENRFIGGSVSVGSSKSIYNTNGETKGNALYAGVFLRQYKPVFGKILAFFQAGITGGHLYSETNQGVDYYLESKAFSASLYLTPGVSVAVSKKVYLEAGFSNIASIHYNKEKQEGYNFGSAINRKLSGFGLSSSLSTSNGGLFFGARFIISR